MTYDAEICLIIGMVIFGSIFVVWIIVTLIRLLIPSKKERCLKSASLREYSDYDHYRYNHYWHYWNERYSDSATVRSVTLRMRDPAQRESICQEVKKAFAHTKYWKNVVHTPEFQECFTEGGPYRGRRKSSIARDVLCANLGCVDCYANMEGYESALYSDNIKEREKEYEYVTTIHKILRDHGVDLKLQCVRDYKEAIYVLEGSMADHVDGRFFWFHDIIPFSHDLVEHPPVRPKRGYYYKDYVDAQKYGKCKTLEEAYEYIDQKREQERPPLKEPEEKPDWRGDFSKH